MNITFQFHTNINQCFLINRYIRTEQQTDDAPRTSLYLSNRKHRDVYMRRIHMIIILALHHVKSTKNFQV